MSAEIHRLTGAGPSFEPIPEIVKHLEDLLVEARMGDIKGFGFFVVTNSDATVHSFEPGCAEASYMIAGASRLFQKVMDADRSLGQHDAPKPVA